VSVLSSRWCRATLAGVIAAFGSAFGAGAAQAATASVDLLFATAPSSFGGNYAGASAVNSYSNTVTIRNLRTGDVRSGPGFAGLNGAPLIGDVIEVDYQGGVFRQTFDGKPSFDSTTCAGKNTISGMLTPGVPTTGALDLPAKPYSGSQQTTPTNNSANNTFSGSFQRPIGSGDHVRVQGFAQSFAVNNSVNLELHETSTTLPPNCPSAPTIPPPSGSLTHGGMFQLGSFDQRHALADLFRGGLRLGFMVDDPNPGPDSLAVDLVPANANPPAEATRNKKHKKHKAKKTNILARGVVTVTAPGTVTVKVLPTAYGRKFLKHKKKQTVTVVDTLKNKKTGVSKTLKFPLALQK
jgi:hypothetical protein